MTYRVTVPHIGGALAPYELTDLLVWPLVAADTTASSAFLYVAGAPTTGATIEIRNLPAGAGDSLGTVSIGAGARSGSVSGTLAVSSGASVYMWITDGDDALELSGHVEFDAAPSFTNLVEVKEHANIDNSSLDSLIATFISGRTVAMQHYMDRKILQQSNTDERHRYWNGWTGTVVLEEAPVQSISSVTVGGDTLVADTDYEVELEAGVIHRMNGDVFVPWEAGEILVDYVSGSANPPDDLRQACIEQVRHDLSQAEEGGNRLGQISRSNDTGGTTTYVPGGWLPSVKEIMDRYREINV